MLLTNLMLAEKMNWQRLKHYQVNQIKKIFITYLNEIILILNKYNVDTQGFYEYMKLIIEAKKD